MMTEGGGRTIHAVVRLTYFDYWFGLFSNLLHSPRRLLLAGAAFGAMPFILALASRVSFNAPRVLETLGRYSLLMGVLYPLFMLLLFPSIMAALVWRVRESREPLQYDFAETGVAITSLTGAATYNWAFIARAFESERLILLRTKYNSVIVLPTRRLPQDVVRSLRALLREQLGAKAALKAA